jgi:hypothetical protein
MNNHLYALTHSPHRCAVCACCERPEFEPPSRHALGCPLRNPERAMPTAGPGRRAPGRGELPEAA